MIFILGKVISGKSEDCNLLYANSPPMMMSTNTTVSGFLCEIKNFCNAYSFFSELMIFTLAVSPNP